MRRHCLGAVLLALPACTVLATAAEARQVYCYLTVMPAGDKLARQVMPGTVHVTPVFQSAADVYLLEALLQEAVPDAGLATCITNDDEADIVADWKNFVDSSKGSGFDVKMEDPPRE